MLRLTTMMSAGVLIAAFLGPAPSGAVAAPAEVQAQAGTQPAAAAKAGKGRRLVVVVKGKRLGKRARIVVRGKKGQARGYKRTLRVRKRVALKRLPIGKYQVRAKRIHRSGRVSKAFPRKRWVKVTRKHAVRTRFNYRVVVRPDRTAPGRVKGLKVAAVATTAVTLTWRNPGDKDLARVTVRRARGSSAPGSPSAGTPVRLDSHTATRVTDTGLKPGARYSYAVFTKDKTGNVNTAGVRVSTTTHQASSGPMISDYLPAFASAGDAWLANDGDYDTVWKPTTGSGTEWLAYDLSGVPTAVRDRVLVAWYVEEDDQFGIGGPAHNPSNDYVRPFLSDYVVEVNSAAGGPVPSSGWTAVARVSGGKRFSGQHVVELAGRNWVRVRGRGPNGIQINVDVAGSASVEDSWLFLGDSITADYTGHDTKVALDGSAVRSFTDLIDAGTSGAHRPIALNAGVDSDRADMSLARIDSWLAAFPGRYVSLNYGTNDIGSYLYDGITPDDYYKYMDALVRKVLAADKTPIISKIPWPNFADPRIGSVAPKLFNDKLDELYRAYPDDLLRGPDLWSLTLDRPELFPEPNDVHPNAAGAAAMRRAWAEMALDTIYRGRQIQR